MVKRINQLLVSGFLILSVMLGLAGPVSAGAQQGGTLVAVGVTVGVSMAATGVILVGPGSDAHNACRIR